MQSRAFSRIGLLSASLCAVLVCACGSKLSAAPPKSAKGAQIQFTPVGCNYTVTSVAGGSNAQYLVSTTPATVPPRHVHASFASDPSSSFAVNWESEPSSTPPVAYLTQLYYGTSQSAVQSATASGNGVTVQSGYTVDYASAIDSGTYRVHEVHVCGLKPATTYYYKVGNTGAFSSVYSLVTAPAPGSTTPIRFAVSGDARTQPDIWDQAEKTIAATNPQPAFQMFSGDAIDIELQSDWDQFFEDNSAGVTASDVMANIPIMTTDGNHEGLGISYLAQFALPQQPGGGEPPGGGLLDSTRAWYSFNYANAHFVVLNDTTVSMNTIGGSEAAWLTTDLQAVNRTTTPWVFVFHHQPEWSCDTTHGSDTQLQQAWGPIFDQFHVDIVFNGHVHNYQRTNILNAGSVVSTSAGGTTYIVAAGVGAPLYGVSTGCGPQFSSASFSYENYVIVDISGNTLNLNAYNLGGGNSVIDTFSISK